MARWNPSGNVDRNERIGRRLFDEPMLAGIDDIKSTGVLLLTNFEDSRGNELSLDRLGQTGIETKVKKYLSKLADSAAIKAKPEKSFDGWAVIQASELEKKRKKFASLPVIASPSGKGEEENKYHAHVVRPDDIEYYFMAFHLQYLFRKHGEICHAER